MTKILRSMIFKGALRLTVLEHMIAISIAIIKTIATIKSGQYSSYQSPIAGLKTQSHTKANVNMSMRVKVK